MNKSIDAVALWLLHKLDAETAHNLALGALQWGLVGTRKVVDDPVLETTLWSLKFSNPIGLAAGFDKNAVALTGLARLGFGFVETGTVTPIAQPGNPKPRLFRLEEDRAIVNRLGFNNDGLDRFVAKMAARQTGSAIVGANVGANKTSEDRIADYATGTERLAPLVDYIVVNVSSPNTPGLRNLQSVENLEEIFSGVLAAREKSGAAKTPILLKVAPDLAPEELDDIASFALGRNVEGIIATNTTVDRPSSLRSPNREEAGGLSGAPLFQKSTDALTRLFKATEARIPIIGVGGVASAADAYLKIRAGASLVQVYSSLIYNGPGSVIRMTTELAELLRKDGFSNVTEAVGIDHL